MKGGNELTKATSWPSSGQSKKIKLTGVGPFQLVLNVAHLCLELELGADEGPVLARGYDGASVVERIPDVGIFESVAHAADHAPCTLLHSRLVGRETSDPRAGA